MAAFLMAAFLRGLNREETVALTRAMMNSGAVLNLKELPQPKIDKHSTGGVGDKVSLILTPLAAACGITVPMISGRSLGHTGGTLDKLAAIPGFRTDLELTEFYQVLKQNGAGFIGQTDELCPADKKLYALRDVTATVESIPLIAASIMAKKLAEDIDGLVLDIKTGTGAFMRRLRDARQLARLMIAIGADTGKRVVAVITGMWQPLGKAVGNSLEVIEAIEALKGNWSSDLQEVTLTLGEEMLLLAGKAQKRTQARRQLLRAITTGNALTKFREIIIAQGGNPKIIDDYTLLPSARYTKDVSAPNSGYVKTINAYQVGLLGLEIGVGRKSLDDKIDFGAGFLFHRKIGDQVKKGEPVATVLANDKKVLETVAQRLTGFFSYSDKPIKPDRIIVDRLTTPATKAQRSHRKRRGH